MFFQYYKIFIKRARHSISWQVRCLWNKENVTLFSASARYQSLRILQSSSVSRVSMKYRIWLMNDTLSCTGVVNFGIFLFFSEEQTGTMFMNWWEYYYHQHLSHQVRVGRSFSYNMLWSKWSWLLNHATLAYIIPNHKWPLVCEINMLQINNHLITYCTKWQIVIQEIIPKTIADLIPAWGYIFTNTVRGVKTVLT